MLSLNPPGQFARQPKSQSGLTPPLFRVAHPPHVLTLFLSGVMQGVKAPRAVHRSTLQEALATRETVVGVGCLTGPKKAKPELQLATRSTHSLQNLFPLLSAGASGIPSLQSARQMRPQTGRTPPSVLAAHPPHVVARFVSGVLQAVCAPRAVHNSKLQCNVTDTGNAANADPMIRVSTVARKAVDFILAIWWLWMSRKAGEPKYMSKLRSSESNARTACLEVQVNNTGETRPFVDVYYAPPLTRWNGYVFCCNIEVYDQERQERRMQQVSEVLQLALTSR